MLNGEVISDADMLRMMANENMSEYGASATTTQETIRQVVRAYGAGRIYLDPVSTMARHAIRYAPSFAVSDADPGRHQPYSSQTVAAFLGWNPDRVQGALAVLEEIERGGVLTHEDFQGLSSNQATGVLVSVRAAEKKARKAGVDPMPAKKAAACGQPRGRFSPRCGPSGRLAARRRRLALPVTAPARTGRPAPPERTGRPRAVRCPSQRRIARELGRAG